MFTPSSVPCRYHAILFAAVAAAGVLMSGETHGQGLEEKPFVPPPAAIKGMLAALSDPNPEVAAFAARRLGDWRRAEVAEELARLLGPETPAPVRDAALVYFARIGASARPHIAAVLRQAGDANARVRELALDAVHSAEAATAHLDVIVPLLKDPRVEVRVLAAECLAQAGPAARAQLPALREALNRSRTSAFRHAVLAAMEVIGGLSLADCEAIVPFLQASQDEVRVAAFGAIESALATAEVADGSPRAAAVEAAARAQFARENDEIRAAMIEGAVPNQQLATAMMDELLAQLASGSSDVQAAALIGISAGREQALPHLARVVEKLDAADPEVCAAAFHALRMMGPQAVVPHLDAVAQALRHSSARVRNEALLALPLAGDALRKFPYHIRTVIPGASPAVRNTLLRAAGVIVEKIGVDDEWLAQGREALASPDRDLRVAMCFVASQFGMAKGAPLFPPLVALLKDPDDAVRGAAAVALRSFATDGDTRTRLREAFRPLLNDHADDVRWAALDTLFDLDPSQDEALVGEIAALMEDEAEGVRNAALRAMGACGPSAKRHLPRILSFFAGGRGTPPYDAVETVLRLGSLDAAELALLLQPIFAAPALLPLLRTTAYAATGGDGERVLLVRLIGRSSGTVASLVKSAEAAHAERQLGQALQASGLQPALKAEIESRLAELQALPR